MQLSLLDKTQGTDPTGPSTGSGMDSAIRPYQTRIVQEALSSTLLGKSTLIEMATGTGKTRVASELVKELPGRVLWIAHRTELIWQATRSLHETTGEDIGQELPDIHSSRQRIVTASKDTIRQVKRLDRLSLNYEPFRFIVVDEAHHAVAKTYQDIFDAWPDAVRIGLTATPDRMDRNSLGRLFESCTTPYTIVQGVNDAWLVPVKAKRCRVQAVDLSSVGTVAGDFAQGELEAVMASEQTIHGCVSALLDRTGSRPTIVFCPGVDSAVRTVEVLHRYKGLCARIVTGQTDPDQRRHAFQEFGKSYQFLVNVQVATEGTDLPAAACIAIMRPTKSRSLFVQMLGRGLRPQPGILGTGPDQRKGWIGSSAKPDCLVLDFVGVTGRHSVITVADVAGSITVESVRAVARVKTRIEAGEDTVDVFEAVQAEEAREVKAQAKRQERKAKAQAKREAITGTATVLVTDAQLIGLGGDPVRLDWSNDVASPGQVDEIVRLGLVPEKYLTKAMARATILARRTELDLATPKQTALLLKNKIEVSPGMTKKQAKVKIWKLMQRWGK